MLLYKNIIRGLNLAKTDAALGTEKVPTNIQNYGLDSNDNIFITYSFLKNQQDVANSYWGISSQNQIHQQFATSNYIQSVEEAMFSVLNDGSYWSASLGNSIVVNFIQPQNLPDPADQSDIGVLAIGQLNGAHPIFPNLSKVAGTFIGPVDSTDPLSDEAFGDIFINVDATGDIDGLLAGKNIWTDFGEVDAGTLAYKTIYEEISHALGIDFVDNNGIVLPSEQSTYKYTITSTTPYGYIPDTNNQNLPILDNDPLSVILWGDDNDGDGQEEVLAPYGLQLYDIAALQELYGRDYLTRTLDDTYTLDQGLGRDNDVSKAFIYTVWDGAGIDEIDASPFSNHSAKIDLRQGEFSSIGTDGKNASLFDWSVDASGIISITKDAGNVAVALHTVIENATGTSENDLIIGNDWNNVLDGGVGDDVIYGNGAAYDGNSGFIDVDATDPNDPNRTRPQDDQDTIVGGAGDDRIDGGTGTDTADYSSDPNGVSVTLDANGDGSATDGFGDTDTLFSIENLILTGENDSVILSAPTGRTIDAGAGIDDTVTYDVPVVEDRNSGPAGTILIHDLQGNTTDTLIGVENVAFNAGVVIPDFDENVILDRSTTPSALRNDYSSYTEDLDFAFTVSSWQRVTLGGGLFFGNGVDFIEAARSSLLSVELDGGAVHTANVTYSALEIYDTQTFSHTAAIDDSLALSSASQNILNITGTNEGDDVVIDTAFEGVDARYQTPEVIFYSGSGDDTIDITDTVAAAPIAIGYRGGDDVVTNAANVNRVLVWEGIQQSEVTITDTGNNIVLNAGAYGTLTLEGADNAPTIVWLEDTNTSIDGTWGADIWTAYAGLDDTYYGLGGNDLISGLDGNDTLYGGLGNDVIQTGAGTDTAYGNDGDDIFIADGRFFNADTYDGGNGTDRAVVDGSFASYSVSGNTYTDTSGFGSSFTFIDIEEIQFLDGVYDAVNDSFAAFGSTGEAADDSFSLVWNTQDIVFDVLSNDEAALTSILAYQQPDHGTVELVDGAFFRYTPDFFYDGADSFSYSVVNSAGDIETASISIDVILAGPGIGTLGDDVLTGTAGFDFLRGLAGNDVLQSTPNVGLGDILEGGLGADIYILDPADKSVRIQETAETYELYGDVFESSSSLLYLNNPNISLSNVSTYFGEDNGDLVIYDPAIGGDNIFATIEDGASFGLIVFSDGTYALSEELLYGDAFTTYQPTEGADFYSYDLYGPLVIDFLGGDDDATGEDFPDVFFGGSGDDTLRGEGGNDRLYGGTGNDTLYESSGIDISDGQDGFDTIGFEFVSQGVDINLSTNQILNDGSGNTGTILNIENIQGTVFNDVVFGSDTGTEIINTYTGDDILAGGKGNADNLRGGHGDDTYLFNLGDGLDTIYDQSGVDTVEFGIGISQFDIILTDNGNNLDITFAHSSDRLRLSNHNHTGQTAQIEKLSFADGTEVDLTGSAMFVTGNTSSNFLLGGGESDELNGLDGNDTLDGGAGDDDLNGGTGDDTYLFDIGDGTNTISEEEGFDTIALGAGIELSDITFAQVGLDLDIQIASGFVVTDFFSGDTDKLVEQLRFDDDTVFDLTSLLTSTNNNDFFDATSVVEFFDGGTEGTDTVSYADSSGRVTVDLQNNTGTHNDAAGDTYASIERVIGTNHGADSLYGDAGDNILLGLDGSDNLEGGAGADILNGGDNTDYARYTRSDTGVDVDLNRATQIGGHAEGDELIDIEHFYGTNYDDIFRGNGTYNNVLARGGNDTLEGRGGSDRLYGGSGNDTFIYEGGKQQFFEESSGIDRVEFNAVWAPEDAYVNGDVILFEEGLNQITFNDITLFEAFAFDGHGDLTLQQLVTLSGGAPVIDNTPSVDDDVLIGTAAAELLDGGAGTDTASYAASSGRVTVDLENNSGTHNLAAGDTYASVENVIGTQNGSDYLYGDANTNHLQALDGNDYLEGGAGADLLDGGDGTDYARYIRSDDAVTVDLIQAVQTGGHAEGDQLVNIEHLYGTAFDDTFRGNDSYNKIYGRNGDDNLDGRGGSDYLYGGNGDDILAGGAGVDLLYGQAGADTFIFKAIYEYSNNDLVQDFRVAEGDKIDISGMLQGYDALTDAITDFVQITDNGTNSYVFVDDDGGADNFIKIATLYGETGLTDEAALESSGTLIAA